MRRIVMILAPWPDVHLLAEMLDNLLDRVMMVVTTARHSPATAIARATAALLRGGRCVRTVPTETLYKTRVVESCPVMVHVFVHTGRVLIHRVGGVRLKQLTPVSVRQQRRQLVLFTCAGVREILMIRLVLVNVVQVVRKELVRRRRGIVVVQRTTADL